MPEFNEAFWRWFGNSKVVDADGNPLVVYHATTFDFTRFESLKHSHFGFHFGNAEQAFVIAKRLKRSKERILREIELERSLAEVRSMSVFLKIENPIRLRDVGDWSNPYAVFEMVNKKLKGKISDLLPAMIDVSQSKQFRLETIKKVLIHFEYDGAIYKNLNEGHGDSWIVFEPWQIKSVDNIGTWDPHDPDIRYNPAVRPGPSSPSEPDWLYHATNEERMAEIAVEGLKPHRPWEFTDQATWPDGATEKRIYFSEHAGIVWQFAPEEGGAVILRVPKSAVAWKHEGTRDVYVTKKIPPQHVEVLWDDGWRSLGEIWDNP
jgi:hypothetical protein